MVVGSDLYHVVVRIRKLGQVAWKAIRAECAGRVGSVLELLQGRLSDHVLRVVTDPDRGLFPKPGEITLTCDCPDWAVMCKHAAAVLYGVGSRLDERPELLFRLRDIDAEDLVVGDMALPDAAAGDDVLAGDLADIFGIDLDPADSGAAAARQGTTGRRRPRRGRPRRTGAPPSGFQPDGPPGGGATPPGRILGPRVRRPAPRIRVDGVPLGSGPRAARPPSRSGGRIAGAVPGNRETPDLSDPARSWPERRGRRAVRPRPRPLCRLPRLSALPRPPAASALGSTGPAARGSDPRRLPRRAPRPKGVVSGNASMAAAGACFRARLAREPSTAGDRTARGLAGYRRTWPPSFDGRGRGVLPGTHRLGAPSAAAEGRRERSGRRTWPPCPRYLPSRAGGSSPTKSLSSATGSTPQSRRSRTVNAALSDPTPPAAATTSPATPWQEAPPCARPGARLAKSPARPDRPPPAERSRRAPHPWPAPRVRRVSASPQRHLKLFRLEAVRAGFRQAWQAKDYATILEVTCKIPDDVLHEDPKLLMWYDQAQTRQRRG